LLYFNLFPFFVLIPEEIEVGARKCLTDNGVRKGGVEADDPVVDGHVESKERVPASHFDDTIRRPER